MTLNQLRMLTLALVLQAPVMASAQTAPTQTEAPPATATRAHRMLERFEAANTSHDGRLTLAQASAAHMPRIVSNFSAIDTGNKGYVTVEDLRDFMIKQRAARQAQNGASPTQQ